MISIVMPYNNSFSSKLTKPVVNATIPYIKNSKFLEDITVISSYAIEQFTFVNTVYADSSVDKANYCSFVLKSIDKLRPKLVEVHQDIVLASNIAKNFPDIKVNLVKHGDYLKNKFKENFFFCRWLYFYKYLKYINQVYCISNFVRIRLAKGYPYKKKDFLLVYNTYGHIKVPAINTKVEKQNTIIFAGKPVRHKGIKNFMLSLPSALRDNNYNAIIVGAFFSSKPKYKTLLSSLLEREDIASLVKKNRIKVIENLSAEETFKELQKAKIAVVPTKTQEPFGLVALEAALAKCAIITTGKGGLKEIVEDKAMSLGSSHPHSITLAARHLIRNPHYMEYYSKNSFQLAKKKFNPRILCERLDSIREINIGNTTPRIK